MTVDRRQVGGRVPAPVLGAEVGAAVEEDPRDIDMATQRGLRGAKGGAAPSQGRF